jgi:hypothetical protein
MQVELQSKKKVKRAFFDIIDTHQDPVAGPDSPIPLWRLKLPNSWKHDNWSADEFGSCPAGPGRHFTEVIHKIDELGVALNLDSWYSVIRNRVGHL